MIWRPKYRCKKEENAHVQVMQVVSFLIRIHTRLYAVPSYSNKRSKTQRLKKKTISIEGLKLVYPRLSRFSFPTVRRKRKKTTFETKQTQLVFHSLFICCVSPFSFLSCLNSFASLVSAFLPDKCTREYLPICAV